MSKKEIVECDVCYEEICSERHAQVIAVLDEAGQHDDSIRVRSTEHLASEHFDACSIGCLATKVAEVTNASRYIGFTVRKGGV